MDTVKLSTKGQLVIPTRFRRSLHLRAGDELVFSQEGGRLILERKPSRRARLVNGRFGRPVLKAPPGAPPMSPETVKAILEEAD